MWIVICTGSPVGSIVLLHPDLFYIFMCLFATQESNPFRENLIKTMVGHLHLGPILLEVSLQEKKSWAPNNAPDYFQQHSIQ